MLIKNLGPIKSGRLNFNDLVVIWGHNNSGKTMLTYLLYAIREEFRKFKLNISEVTDNDYFSQVNNGNMVNISDAEVLKMFDNFQTYFENNSVRLMSNYFSIGEEYFKDFYIEFEENEIFKVFPIIGKKSRGFHRNIKNGLEIENTFLLEKTGTGWNFGLSSQKFNQESMEFDDGENTEVLKSEVLDFSRSQFDDYLSGFFKFLTRSQKNIYFPAERIGINQFREELKTYRAIKSSDFDSYIKNNKRHVDKLYPVPVEDYFKFVFSLDERYRYESYRKTNINLEKLIEGEFIYNEDLNDYEYRMSNSSKNIPFKIMSSSLKSLFGLSEYLDRLKPWMSAGTIMIDEPEMNLHPSKQVEIIDSITNIVSGKISKVIISTHSSYITRKLLNILLSQNSKIEKNKLTENNINIYEIKNGIINKVDIIDSQNFIENFDQTSFDLDEEYFELINSVTNGDEIDG